MSSPLSQSVSFLFAPRAKLLAALLALIVVAGDRTPVGAETNGRPSLSRAEKVARARASYYRVRRGDTLGRIARRFRTTPAVLVRWNSIEKQGQLRAGSRILVPPVKTKARRSRAAASKKKKEARPPESHAWSKAPSGTALLLPKGFEAPKPRELRFADPDFEVRLFARAFRQGEAGYLELVRKAGRGQATTSQANVRVYFAGSEVPLHKTEYGFRALLAFSPYRKPGTESLELAPSGAAARRAYRVTIARGDFPTVVWKSFLGDYDRPRPKLTEEQKRQAAERARRARELLRSASAKKKEAFAKRTADKFDARLAHPRGRHHVTDPFFVSRKIVQYYVKNRRKHWKKPFIRKHHGLDLYGQKGAPIYAMADGVVVAAQLMFYEGNFTVIDHGQGIFTGYMHQSRMLVKEGDRVSAGQLIGEVGATGRVTGPHLHAGLYIRDVPVHPLSLLALPIR